MYLLMNSNNLLYLLKTSPNTLDLKRNKLLQQTLVNISLKQVLLLNKYLLLYVPPKHSKPERTMSLYQYLVMIYLKRLIDKYLNQYQTIIVNLIPNYLKTTVTIYSLSIECNKVMTSYTLNHWVYVPSRGRSNQTYCSTVMDLIECCHVQIVYVLVIT